MKLLLDTHAFLWWQQDNRKLKRPARDAIERADLVFVSAASAWEVAIKESLGRLELTAEFAAAVDDAGFERLTIDFHHVELVRALPHHHGDPFDRVLVAQCRADGLTLVTHDRQLEPYGVPIIWT